MAEVHRILANPRVHRPGAVKILNLESDTAYALDEKKGPSRVAWTVIGTLPVVQCVTVHRSGDFLTDAKTGWRDAYAAQMRAAVRPLQKQAAE